jgi:hypothetical protein
MRRLKTTPCLDVAGICGAGQLVVAGSMDMQSTCLATADSNRCWITGVTAQQFREAITGTSHKKTRLRCRSRRSCIFLSMSCSMPTSMLCHRAPMPATLGRWRALSHRMLPGTSTGLGGTHGYTAQLCCSIRQRRVSHRRQCLHLHRHVAPPQAAR